MDGRRPDRTLSRAAQRVGRYPGRMTTTTEVTPSRAPTAAVAVVLLGLVGIAVEAIPSLVRLLTPPAVQWCPLSWPSSTACAPGLHMVVVAIAGGVLLVAMILALRMLRRSADAAGRAGVLVLLSLVALVAWSAARVPQPFFQLMG